MRLDVRYLACPEAAALEIGPGWWAFDEMGPILGPYSLDQAMRLFPSVELGPFDARSSDDR